MYISSGKLVDKSCHNTYFNTSEPNIVSLEILLIPTIVLQGVNEMKNITCEQMTNVVKNIATFVDYIAMETSSPTWATILVQFDLFFRRLPTLLPNPCDVTPVLKIMIAVLKIPGLTSVKVAMFWLHLLISRCIILQ